MQPSLKSCETQDEAEAGIPKLLGISHCWKPRGARNKGAPGPARRLGSGFSRLLDIQTSLEISEKLRTEEALQMRMSQGLEEWETPAWLHRDCPQFSSDCLETDQPSAGHLDLLGSADKGFLRAPHWWFLRKTVLGSRLVIVHCGKWVYTTPSGWTRD